jgi:hypothetical protein
LHGRKCLVSTLLVVTWLKVTTETKTNHLRKVPILDLISYQTERSLNQQNTEQNSTASQRGGGGADLVKILNVKDEGLSMDA